MALKMVFLFYLYEFLFCLTVSVYFESEKSLVDLLHQICNKETANSINLIKPLNLIAKRLEGKDYHTFGIDLADLFTW